jgi:hypothetical protein
LFHHRRQLHDLSGLGRSSGRILHNQITSDEVSA